MRVIGAGWGRTGTTTAAAALEILGFGPCVQMQDMWARPDLAATWVAHHGGTPADWPVVLADYASCVDWPGCWEWRDFADLWPEAAVLLTVRDPETWYDSVVATIHAWTAPGQDVGPPPVAALLRRLWEVDFGGWDAVSDRSATIARFEAHQADVRATCPPQRLVEWDVRDGWGPLCTGLGVDVPDRPLPHLNQRG